MTVGAGEPWGEPGVLPSDGVLVHTDRTIGDRFERCRREGLPPPVFGLLEGDLARTCGATGDEGRLRSRDAQRLPVDIGEALVDGVVHHFAAHLVVRGRTWWRGPICVVMNAQFLGRWDVAPRSHPNDGRLDVFEADLTPGDRWKAWRRLPSGTHVPHPGIRQRRSAEVEIDVPAGAAVWLDGERIGPARSLSVRCVPDAVTVVV